MTTLVAMKSCHACVLLSAVVLSLGSRAWAEQGSIRVFWSDKDDGVVEVVGCSEGEVVEAGRLLVQIG